MEKYIEKRSGKKGVAIRENKHGLELLTVRNGYQWSGAPVDDDILDMLQEAIAEFKAMRANVKVSGGAPTVDESAAVEPTAFGLRSNDQSPERDERDRDCGM